MVSERLPYVAMGVLLTARVCPVVVVGRQKKGVGRSLQTLYQQESACVSWHRVREKGDCNSGR